MSDGRSDLAARKRGTRAVLFVSAVGGAGTMVVELGAVRLLAPWFGSSQVVWSNVIAVVLLALAVGYRIGGWLSGRGRPLSRLGTMLILAGVSAAWLPALASVVAQLFLPVGLALHEAADVVLWGSLAASLLLFLPPAALLGCVAPLAVEAVQELEGRSAGHAGGAVLCASTVGSLAGVFGTSHYLLPELGLTVTFLVASATLMLAGVAGWLLDRSGRSSAGLVGVAFLLWGGALYGSRADRPELPAGQTELAYGESAYQSVRVVEDTTRVDAPLRYLQVNEGFDSYQSVWQPAPGLLPTGFYYNDFVLPSAWSGARPTGGTSVWRLLVLGLGAGTALRVIEAELPPSVELDAVGVELDPLVVRFAREHMDLAPESEVRQVAVGLDARVALRNVDHQFDQIVLDCYANQVEIPPHLCTLEFFREVRERLVPGGWLSANLGGFGFDDPVVRAVARTCALAFEADVLVLRVPFSRNFSLIVRRDAPLPVGPDGQLDESAHPAPDVAALLAPRALPGSWRVFDSTADATILTDDRCPIEWLQLRSIEEGADRLRSAGG